MNKRRGISAMLALTVVTGLVLVGLNGARSQTPFREGAFVLDKDGYAYVVSGGTAYPIQFATDDAGVLSNMPQGQTVSALSDIPGAPTPTPTSTPAPAANTAPSPHPTVAAGVGTRDNPVPIGTTVTLPDGWQITVLSVTPDATAQILAGSSSHRQPEADHQFLLARISATYTGADSSQFNDYRLITVGPAAVSYSEGCSSFPDELPFSEVFTGGTVTGNVCWSVLTNDVGALVMYDDRVPRDKRVFLSLH